jgi:mono/diheme cytochrome c family protein
MAIAYSVVMPGLVPGIHDLLPMQQTKKDVDGRDKPGHDGSMRRQLIAAVAFFTILASPPPARAAEGDVDLGRDTYGELCVTCHGRDMVNPGTLSFDLRKFPKDDFARFKESVLNGKGRAMPAWRDKVSDDDISNLWAYVRSGG